MSDSVFKQSGETLPNREQEDESMGVGRVVNMKGEPINDASPLKDIIVSPEIWQLEAAPRYREHVTEDEAAVAFGKA